jgi:hypothetical protein
VLSEKDVIGTWRLVAHYYLGEDSSVTEGPLGPDADGLLIYQADGYMAASVMRNPESGTPAGTYLGTESDYLGYSGRWWVRGEDGVVVHDVVIGSHPRVVNTQQLREAQVADGGLSLRRWLEGSSQYIVMDWKRA